MNAMHLFAAQPWVERLGITLLHFLWQGVLIAAVYAAVRRGIARSASANIRYMLACVALVAMAAAPVLTWNLLRPPSPGSVAATFTAPVSAATAAVRNAPAPFSGGADFAKPSPFLPCVVTVWFAGAMAFWLRLLGGWVLAERLRSRLVRPAPPEWQQALDRLKNSIRVFRPVRLLVSGLVEAPAVVGWLRPALLVPVGALAGLPRGQVEALLLHELAHIRRHDYLVNALQSIVEALLFYHPAVWWISGHIRTERELCCDDMAVAVTGDPVTYARALAELESASPVHFKTAMAASGGLLAHRIARLLGQYRPAPHPLAGPGISAAALLPAIAAFAVFGQPSARPQFAVASIKPSSARTLMTVRPMPGRLLADASVRLLLQNAYTVQPFQIAGGPEWMAADRYQIEAKAGGNASRAQMFLMLQSLLHDRFQLKLHRETRELPIYALVPARNGLKLTPPKEGNCVEPAPDAPSDWAGGRMAPPGEGRLPLAICGRVSVILQSGGARMQGGKILMVELVRELSLVLGRTVIDKTGFTRLLDVGLDFQPDETTPAMPPPPPNAGASSDVGSPPLVDAIQRLGLRLEAARGPVEVIVVDHVERPSAN
jgi:uncharacterized protein (TIGR03435 family)